MTALETRIQIMDKQQIFVIGATGFIGRNLLAAFSTRKDTSVSFLTRNPDAEIARQYPNFALVQGDFENIDEVQQHIPAGATVINLVYLADRDSRHQRWIREHGRLLPRLAPSRPRDGPSRPA